MPGRPLEEFTGQACAMPAVVIDNRQISTQEVPLTGAPKQLRLSQTLSSPQKLLAAALSNSSCLKGMSAAAMSSFAAVRGKPAGTRILPSDFRAGLVPAFIT